MNLQQLNDAQIAAVTAPLGPTLVLAGAGSGKTRVLTNRILYLVQEKGVSPSEILAITFTNKAANEMKRRLMDFDCHAEYMQISTIHSFCARVLRYEAAQLSRNSNFSIYIEDDKKSVIKKIIKASFDDSDAKMVDGFCDSISAIKNNAPDLLDGDLSKLQQTDEYLASELEKLTAITQTEDNDQLIAVINEYSARMTENNALDFDDLLYYVHKLFVSSPETLDKYSERFKYILIDEFQDTNKVQYQIFKLMAQKYKNIFVVGDDDQSIYSWRGADALNLQKFQRDFPECKLFKLEQNYRSTKRILKVANHIIKPNTDRFSKVLWTENEDGIKPQLYSADKESYEAYYVCEQIKNIMYRNSQYKLRDFAILMRINALSRSFELEFQRNRIPYKVFGGFKFFERKEIKDILAYLRLINNHCDAEAFARSINVPRKRGIGDTTLAKLRNLSAEYGISMLQVCSDVRNLETFNKPTQKKLNDFYLEIEQFVKMERALNLTDFIHMLLGTLDFRKVLLEMGEEDRAINIDEFEQTVVNFVQDMPDATLSDFLSSVSLMSDIDEEDNHDYVTIATIHAVKGLEFKNVFVVGLEEGIFPTIRSIYESNTLQEERRLMYVAVTRAQKRLYLTCAKTRFLYGQHKNTIASRYFAEVQEMQAPVRQPATERELLDDKFLDKLNSREPAPAVSTGKTKAEIAKFKAGNVVNHATFGEGMVMAVKGDIAEVFFKSVGKKSLNIKFTPMEIVK
ncbi:MAG: UvrD-helicase domain-containing protein [Clostridia bacterium]|nr:UvrD-helicase domain-containing protein [Clostridia bacterium]